MFCTLAMQNIPNSFHRKYYVKCYQITRKGFGRRELWRRDILPQSRRVEE